jgi:FkbM family methyltransferase
MKEVQGWWLPEKESHIQDYFKAVNQPAYQPVHQQTAVKHCSKFRTAIDIGAHVGLWARGLTEKFDKVICFEPCDEFADLLAKNAPKVHTIHRCALGWREGFVKMDITPENTGSTHIDRSATGMTPMFPLDHFNLKDVDLVKIDVEGYELDVIKGGFNTFKDNDPLVIVEQKERYVIPEEGRHAAVRFLMRELNYRVINRVVDDWLLRKI